MHKTLMPIPPPTTKSGHVTSERAASDAVMARYGITFNGRHFVYDRFRYERLADAVAYASLEA
jgi:hypothetical protein